MCGIDVTLTTQHGESSNDHKSSQLAQSRGRSAYASVEVAVPGNRRLIMNGAVLNLRGPVVAQPVDLPECTLCFNGELYGGLPQLDTNENDTRMLAESMAAVFSRSSPYSFPDYLSTVASVLEKLRGPWSIVCFDKLRQCLWIGRDYFGRRSLCTARFSGGTTRVCSVADPGIGARELESNCAADPTCVSEWVEMTAAGIVCLALEDDEDSVYRIPWQFSAGTAAKKYEEEGESTLSDSVNTMKRHCLRSFCSNHFAHLGPLCEVSDVFLLAPVTTVNTVLPTHDGQECQGNDTECQVAQLQLADPLPLTFMTGLKPPPRDVLPSMERGEACLHLLELLRQSVKHRVAHFGRYTHCAATAESVIQTGSHCLPPVGILFSGGVDCAILAMLAHQCLPPDMSIDLLNVAFENTARRRQDDGDVYSVPDRITGRATFAELQTLAGERDWRFVEVDVPKVELDAHRSHVQQLVHPLTTVLDESIGLALWFASRGVGTRRFADGSTAVYHSTTPVLLLGMGADEQFGGYSRHRTAFERQGWGAVLQQVEQDVRRISTRNLGRDDRVIGDHSKEGRYPFLDESVVDFVSRLPLHVKMDFEEPRGAGEKILLRDVARALGLTNAATHAKRAIQFGSRVAKMERGSKAKGSDAATPANAR